MKQRLLIAIKNNMIVVWLRIMIEKIGESFILARYNGSTNQYNNIDKKQAELQIRTHALEKGMSIGNVKIGFGKPKVLALLTDLSDYLYKGGDKQFAFECISVINQYLEFNKTLGADMASVEDLFNKFVNEQDIHPQAMGGVLKFTLKETIAQRALPFSEFSQSRYSMRDFGAIPLDLNKLNAAFELCERSPSACNRQSWRIHVYTQKDLRDKMFRLQGGCVGFDQDMQCAILVCTDLRNYGFYEQNLPYVDGGLYAMNLLYALQYNGLAAIPLTMGRKWIDICNIKKEMNLPANETPVILIGVGTFKEEYKVAVSHRYPYTDYVKYN